MPQLNYVCDHMPEEGPSLDSFLKDWDRDYQSRIQEVELFKPESTSNWTKEQKVLFTKAFYHVRGHFHDFLWFIGNHAESKHVKDIILKNISEEMNGSARSHELLYIDFAKSLGVDVEREFIEEEAYLDSIREFNKGHLQWLNAHNNASRFSAFSAYERLDNLDYQALLNAMTALNVPQPALLFFKVHTRVQHFEATLTELKKIWHRSPQAVIEAFQFISNHQLKMWNDLSKSIVFDKKATKRRQPIEIKYFIGKETT